jgi:hypothetical protein
MFMPKILDARSSGFTFVCSPLLEKLSFKSILIKGLCRVVGAMERRLVQYPNVDDSASSHPAAGGMGEAANELQLKQSRIAEARMT